jgi:ribonuclease G
MSQTYIIESSIGEWRTAIIDDDEIPVEVNFLYDAALDPTDVVSAARVSAIDKTLDMAFITLPNGEQGMLNYRRAKSIAKERGIKYTAGIADCVTEGELIYVQALGAASTIEDKAIPLSGKIKIVGRYLVVESGKGRLNLSKDLPTHTIGVIRKALEPLAAEHALVVRSRSATVPVEAVVAEAKWIIDALTNTSRDTQMLFAPSPLERALMAVPDNIDTIIIQGGDNFAAAKLLCNILWPDLSDKLELYKGSDGVFEAFGIEEAIEEAIADKIELPCGGWIAVFETPALTAIDVNMGSALKGQSAADAKRIVNLEAALAVAFHMRFQNMGGLIVVDFIDNPAKGAVSEILHYLEDALDQDPVPIQKSGLSSFGLMQFNRRRRGLSLRQRMLTTSAPSERADYQARKLLRQAKQIGMQSGMGNLVLQGPQSVVSYLSVHKDLLESLKAATARVITLKVGDSLEAYIQGSMHV